MVSADRFRRLCRDLGAAADATALFSTLSRAWREPHRVYHTLDHLADCLTELDRVAVPVDSLAEVEAALWFHDAIYDTRRRDNEARSAAWAVEALGALGIAEQKTARIAEHVLATKHEGLPRSRDAELVVDVDLSILGRAPDEFDAYEMRVRAEYGWVPEDEFRAGRAKILGALLARPILYRTAAFRERYERQARANLRRSLASLS
jgi:predicted metal-dependent HD superfamily phosphohydrolase